MSNGSNPDAVTLNSVYVSIVAVDKFPHVRIVILRHSSSELGESFQTINGENDTFGKTDGLGR